MVKRCLRKARLYISLNIIAAAVSSFSLSFIPLVDGIGEGKSSIAAYIIAAVFWICLFLSLFAAYSTKCTLYKFRKKLIHLGYIDRRHRPGIVSFTKSRESLIIYLINILGFLLIISDIAFSFIPESIMFPVISVTILSFAIHCVIDGKYYKVYKLIKERLNNETNPKA